MKDLKAFVGYGRVTYIELILKEIELQRDIFMMELSMGNETVIPRQLRAQNLSLSYRFYDSTLRYVQEQMSSKVIEHFALRFNLNIQRIEDDSNLFQKLIQIIGVSDKMKILKPKRITYKYPVIQQNNIIDHSESLHCIGIQQSKFMMIQNDMKDLKNLYERYKGGLFTDEHKDFKRIKNWTGKLDL